MYYIELHYTNGKKVRLPQPYLLWQEANHAAMQLISAYYNVDIVQD